MRNPQFCVSGKGYGKVGPYMVSNVTAAIWVSFEERLSWSRISIMKIRRSSPYTMKMYDRHGNMTPLYSDTKLDTLQFYEYM